mmetsp:Transcript_13372/g.16131  ORF Transcript_13372/g.16131 Transcript_13372/m.16131 type:complete len:96 (-) Transcript_13372:142-429(-)
MEPPKTANAIKTSTYGATVMENDIHNHEPSTAISMPNLQDKISIFEEEDGIPFQSNPWWKKATLGAVVVGSLIIGKQYLTGNPAALTEEVANRFH